MPARLTSVPAWNRARVSARRTLPLVVRGIVPGGVTHDLVELEARRFAHTAPHLFHHVAVGDAGARFDDATTWSDSSIRLTPKTTTPEARMPGRSAIADSRSGG